MRRKDCEKGVQMDGYEVLGSSVHRRQSSLKRELLRYLIAENLLVLAFLGRVYKLFGMEDSSR